MTCHEVQLDLSTCARERAYETFRAENPGIIADFTARALGYWRDGHRHLSARMIWEEMRSAGIRARRDNFQLNNNHLPFVVRDFLREHPTCRVFETRSTAERPKVSRRAKGDAP